MICPAHDDVVQHRDSHNFARFVEATGYSNVLCRRLGITARVVVPNNNGYGTAANCITKDLSWMYKRRCMISD